MEPGICVRQLRGLVRILSFRLHAVTWRITSNLNVDEAAVLLRVPPLPSLSLRGFSSGLLLMPLKAARWCQQLPFSSRSAVTS